MTSIAQHIKELQASLPAGVTLVAVSKFHPVEALQEAYDAGQRVFGESRAQELVAKARVLPKDIEWHFIGPLQSNKVKDIAPFIHLIHSIDSPHLLAEVDRQAAKAGRATVDCLLQVHIAAEETKFGFTPDECRQYLASGEWKPLEHVRLCGLMGMATNTDDMQQVQKEFQGLARLFREVRDEWFATSPWFKELSMGMSHDYHEAIAAGSTLVRVGSHIFGERNYNINP